VEVTFVELSSGRLLNLAHAKEFRPMGSVWHLVWSDGHYENIAGEDAQAVRAALKPEGGAKARRKAMKTG
jgi:hypothetical protein